MLSKATIKRIRSLEAKKHRMAEGLFVAEGRKIIEEIGRVLPPKEVFLGEEAVSASLLQHPQGQLALFPIDIFERIEPLSQLKLMLDGVQDPGNMGTIIRLADWFGIDHIYCSKDTVDALNPKVVQASMGAIAHVKVEYVDLERVLKALPKDFPVYATTLDGKNIYEEKLSHEGIIVMGNEGNGISENVKSLVNRRITIPPYSSRPTVESLNVAVATAIVCAEFRRI